MHIVIDTNVLVSGIFWGGSGLRILELWMEGRVTVVANEEMLEEYWEILRELGKRRNSELSNQWKMLILENVTLTPSTSAVQICRDPDDDKFLSCAIAADADYVVSGDKDLLVLKTVGDIEIVTPRAFLDRHFPA